MKDIPDTPEKKAQGMYLQGLGPKPDFGYHAGDLGKAEDYFIQSGDRGTGHFGTGTYFVGDPKEIGEGSGYENRPHHKVDFSKYNMFKPKNESEAFMLHNQLKNINGDLTYLDNDKRKEKENLLSKAKKFGNFTYNDDFKELNENNVFNNYDEFVDFYNSLANDYNNYYWAHPKPMEKINNEEKIESYNDFKNYKNNEDLYRKLSTNARDLYGFLRPSHIEKQLSSTSSIPSNLYMLFGKEKVDNALKKVFDTAKEYEAKGGKAASRNNNWDSLSTVFMKALGYGGVDVRGLKGLDNTEFGSVIYDL